MVKINRVYTRTGDEGTTGLVGGQRISKSARRVCAYGDLDELNSWLGLIRTIVPAEEIGPSLAQIQNDLFDIGAELATPSDRIASVQIEEGAVKRLEDWIDAENKGLPELRSFILPGGTTANAYFHLARAVCRRAEREICSLNEVEPVRALLMEYVNRLSDLLFVLAR